MEKAIPEKSERGYLVLTEKWEDLMEKAILEKSERGYLVLTE